MDDVEYILRIILKARDEMAAVLQKARIQLRGFAKDSDTMNVAVTNLNQAMKNFDGHMDGITKKLEGWRAILRDAGDESKKFGKTLDDTGKAATKAAKAQKELNLTQDQLQKRARGLRDEMRGIGKEHEAGMISTEKAISKYKKFRSELEEVTLKMSQASRTKSPAHLWADEAEAASTRLRNIEKTNLDAAKQNAAEQKSLLADINKAVDEHVKKRAAAEKATTEINKAETADRMRIANAEIDALVQKRTEQERAVKKAADDLATAEKAIEDKKQAIRDRREAQRVTRERLAAQRTRITEESDPSEIRRLAAEYDKLARSYRVGSARAKEFGTEAERLRTVIRKTTTDTDRSKGAFDRLTAALSKSHGSVAGFDNQMRGMGILAAVASIDQLISAAIALGGELVSLAGSAVMAGGALGGILAAGAAQALPVLGLLAGAAQRVGSVMEAMTAQQQLQKATATDAEKGGQKAVDQANTLANANDAVADANDRLAESREALTQANKDGTDQLQDLILAEKQAALAAKGAALDVKSAQEALRLAVAGGASQLEIDQKRQALSEARLSQTGANVDAGRATRDRRAAGGKVGNLESVKSAAKAVEDAEKAVVKANRGLDQAEAKADRAASSTMTAAANLNFLLSQLSPAEKRLYNALQSIYDTYKKIFQGEGTGGSGIYGVIIDSFTRAVTKVEEIMEMPKVIEGIQELANIIGENIDKIVDAIDPAVIEQLLTIIEDSGENLGPLVDMAIDLAKAFLNISETANPAFQKLLEYLGPIVDKFLDLTSNKKNMEEFFETGEEHLESWLDLLFAVIGLFAALTGASAESGKTSIDDLTEKIKGWTDWIEDHHDEVVAFFEDAREAAYSIGGVLENLAVTLAKSFSAERVEKFASILNDIVIPAIGDFIDLVGKLTDGVAKLLENPVVAQVAKWALALGFVMKLAGPITGLFAGAIKNVLIFGKVIFDVGRFLVGTGAHFAKFIGYLEKLPGILAGLSRLMPLIFGPWGLVIAAVVVGIGLLLHHFGKLDDIWNAIKESAKGFLKDIEPAIKSLQEALGGLGIKMDDLGDVLKFLEKAGSFLATWIATYLIENIKGMFKVAAGIVSFIIKVIAGLIKFIKGNADVIIGFFTMDWDRIKKGFKEMGDGLVDIFWGILDGIRLVFEGLTKIMLAPFKAAWNAIKDFFGIKSPSRKAKELGKNIIEGIKDGLVGLARWLTSPFRRAWDAVNDYFDGKPKKLAEAIVDELVDRMKMIWRRLRNAASYLWNKFKDGFDAAKNFGGTIVNAIVDGIKALPGKMLEAITSIASELFNIGKTIGGKIVEGIKSVAGSVKDFFTGGGDDDDKKPAQGPAKPANATAPTFKLDVGAGLIPFGAKDLKDAENIYGKFWDELRRDARNSTDYIQRQFREMRIATTGSSTKMYQDIRSNLRDIQNSFKVRGAAMGDSWTASWLNISKVAYEGMNYIGSQTNKMLKALSEKHINFGLAAPKAEKGKAGGGWIGQPGMRGKDKGFYSLGDGEAVLGWQHQPYVETALNAQYGFGLGGLFNRVRGYHAGGKEDATGFATGGMVPIPGAPGKTIHSSIVGDVVKLMKQYKLAIYDGYAASGHAAGGEHPKGLAIDAGPDPSKGGTWGLVTKLANWAEPSQDNPRDPFRWVGYTGDPNHGPGNHIHLSWIAGKAIHGLANMATEVKKRLVTGPAGALKTMLTASIEGIRKVANKFLDEKASAVTGEGYEGDVGDVGPGAANIFKFFRTHGFTDEQAAGWIGNLVQESGLDPTAVQPNGEGHGLAQWGHGRFDALVAFAKARGKPWQDMGSQLAFILHELSGSESAAGAAIHAAKTVQQAVDAIGQKYERFGVAGSRSAPAEAAYRKYAGKYDVGGEIPGPEGMPVPILAHAQEWILNPGQQGFLANLIGTGRDTLKAMLGFSGGPVSFAGGGEVRKRALKAAGKIVSRVELDLSDDLMQNVEQSLADLRGLMRAVPKIKKVTNSVKPIIDLIELSTKEGGFLDQLRGSIEKQFTRTALRLRQATYEVGAGREVKYRAGRNTEAERAGYALTAVRGQREELTGERAQINAELKLVADRLKGNKVKGDARKKLLAQQIDLTNRMAEADERVQQNEEDIFAAQEEVKRLEEEAAEKRKENALKLVEDIKKRFSRANASNEIFRRMATAVGNTDWLTQINKRQSDLLTQQAKELEDRIASLRAVGANEEADALMEEVADLRVQVFEMAHQALRDAMDAIGNAAQRRSTVSDLFGRMADAMGLVGQGAQAVIGPMAGGIAGLGSMSRGQVAQGRIASAVTERAGYAGLLGQAQAAGNIGLVTELTDRINELTVVIAENTKAERDARFAATQEEFDFANTMNDLNRQLVEATDATTGQTSSAELLRLAQEKLALYQARQLELQTQLQDAMLAGDVKATRDLQRALLENQIAVQQNTKAVNEITGAGSAPASYTSTAWQWFRTAFLTGTDGVMPQYTPPVMSDMSSIGPAGTTSTTNAGNTYNTEVTVNEAGGPVDVTKIASSVVFAQATAQ